MFSEESLKELRGIAQSVGAEAVNKTQSCRLSVVHDSPGRYVALKADRGDILLSLTDSNGLPLYGIESLSLNKRCKHTILEGNTFFIRTKGPHGLLTLTTSGSGIRFAFVDGTWLGDVRRDAFFNCLDQL